MELADKLLHVGCSFKAIAVDDKTVTVLLTKPGPEAGDHSAKGDSPNFASALSAAVENAREQGWLNAENFPDGPRPSGILPAIAHNTKRGIELEIATRTVAGTLTVANEWLGRNVTEGEQISLVLEPAK